ncbi:hypothetical protein SAMN04487831_11756 [Pseudobutyrivibrio sp. UC1225]|uniref:hypothetical protein n=1 Tax=Pseudobutyrivibrio sp. UC1225 TaxID=1798185 RepID=UPI0008E770C9|nr:hypothetical protein [Pseudobutyrivibrio sp. UC1225]SFO30167.1 hypothetical protein SAMN04487831_11756 [Pseudobutyrivibrio sp. UC1225]
MRKTIVRAMMAVMVCCSMLAGSFLTVNAASAGWSLRYLKGAPTSENVMSWSKGATTVQTTTTMRVNNISHGAEVFVYTDNGISAFLSSNGASASTQTRKGISVLGYVNFSNCGSGSNSPSGTFSY